MGTREVEKGKRTVLRERGDIDLFLTANQFNNSVNGGIWGVWDMVNGVGGKPEKLS